MIDSKRCIHYLFIDDCSECSGKKVIEFEQYRCGWVDKTTDEHMSSCRTRKVIRYSPKVSVMDKKTERLSKSTGVKCTGDGMLITIKR